MGTCTDIFSSMQEPQVLTYTLQLISLVQSYWVRLLSSSAAVCVRFCWRGVLYVQTDASEICEQELHVRAAFGGAAALFRAS